MNRITDITKLTAITKVFFGGLLKLATDYISKVISDGGTVSSKTATNDIYKSLPEQDSIQFAWIGGAGSKKRTSTIWDYFTKLYDMFFGEVDGVELAQNMEEADGTGATISYVDRVVTATSDSTGSSARPKLTMLVADGFVIGKYYKLQISSLNITSGTPRFRLYDGAFYIVEEDLSNKSFYFEMVADNTFMAFDATSIWSFSATVSVKEVNSLPNDATQTTESLQPYVGGNIAPNENEGMKNVNGDGRYVEHPDISFAADEAWSITTVLNYNGSDQVESYYMGRGQTDSIVGVRSSSNCRFRFVNADLASANTPAYSLNFIVGKVVAITIVAQGDGTLLLYINGALFDTLIVATNATFNNIILGRNTTRIFEGILPAHIIHRAALTPTEVETMHSDLSNLYPEIPSVTIGTQEWATSNFEAVATPMGTIIPEVQEGSNVEEISGGDMESGLVGTLTSADETSTWTLNTTNPISGSQDGLLQVTSVGTNELRPRLEFGTTRVNGELRKVSFNYKVNSGTCIFKGYYKGSSAELNDVVLTGSGTFTDYYIVDGTTTVLSLWFDGKNNFNVQIDNVSNQKLEWEGSQEIYDYHISQGETVYDATKAAAMWQYPDNDLAKGAIYGKEFNKFAAKLFQADIDTYNASNPDWGYHIPTRAELTTLSSIGGNTAKKDGADYWLTANGNNSSGLTLLGSGYVDGSGAYVDEKESMLLLCSDDDFARKVVDGDNSFDEVSITVDGGSLRLIKD